MTLNYDKLFLNLKKEIDVYNLGIILASTAPSRLFSIKTSQGFVNLIRSTLQEYQVKIDPEDIEQFLIGFSVGIEAYWNIEIIITWEILEEGEILPEETVIWMSDGDEHLTVTTLEAGNG